MARREFARPELGRGVLAERKGVGGLHAGDGRRRALV